MGQEQHTAIKELFFFFLIFLTELLEPEKMSNLMKRCSEHTDNLEACLGT